VQYIKNLFTFQDAVVPMLKKISEKAEQTYFFHKTKFSYWQSLKFLATMQFNKTMQFKKIKIKISVETQNKKFHRCMI
jgi:hypothetical protein